MTTTNERAILVSLDYDLRKIADRGTLHNTAPEGQNAAFPKGSPEDIEGDRQWNITQSIVFRTMYIGMRQITEKNYEKFFERLSIADAVLGEPLVSGEGKKYSISLADVKRRIGLSTNASNTTDAEFKKRVWATLTDDAQRELRGQRDDLARDAA